MAFWGAVAAAVIASSAAIASESMKGGKGAPAGGSVGGEKKGFEMPDLFKNKGGSLMGGGSNQAPGLSQKLAEPTAIPQPAPQQFGPAAGGGAFDEMKRQRRLKSLMGGF